MVDGKERLILNEDGFANAGIDKMPVENISYWQLINRARLFLINFAYTRFCFDKIHSRTKFC